MARLERAASGSEIVAPCRCETKGSRTANNSKSAEPRKLFSYGILLKSRMAEGWLTPGLRRTGMRWIFQCPPDLRTSRDCSALDFPSVRRTFDVCPRVNCIVALIVTPDDAIPRRLDTRSGLRSRGRSSPNVVAQGHFRPIQPGLPPVDVRLAPKATLAGMATAGGALRLARGLRFKFPNWELRIMRYELTDSEWAAIKPMLPNLSRAACHG